MKFIKIMLRILALTGLFSSVQTTEQRLPVTVYVKNKTDKRIYYTVEGAIFANGDASVYPGETRATLLTEDVYSKKSGGGYKSISLYDGTPSWKSQSIPLIHHDEWKSDYTPSGSQPEIYLEVEKNPSTGNLEATLPTAW